MKKFTILALLISAQSFSAAPTALENSVIKFAFACSQRMGGRVPDLTPNKKIQVEESVKAIPSNDASSEDEGDVLALLPKEGFQMRVVYTVDKEGRFTVQSIAATGFSVEGLTVQDLDECQVGIGRNLRR
jgi:hypothetical protein